MALRPSLSFLLPLLLFLPALKAEEYYISPLNSPLPCPVAECHNLSYFLDVPDLYFADDTILYFMEGTHYFDEEEMLAINGVSNLSLTTMGVGEVNIHCSNRRGGIGFLNCQNITLQGFTMSNCGAFLPSELAHGIYHYTLTSVWVYLYGSHSLHTLFFTAVEDLHINGVTIQYSRGRAISGINTFNVNITDSIFRYNNIESFTDPNCDHKSHYNTTCHGGNVYLLYVDPRDCSPINQAYYYIDISRSSFTHGIDRINIFTNGGLGIGMLHSSNYGIDIRITDVLIEANTAFRGANFGLTIVNSVRYHTLSVRNLTSIFANSIYPSSESYATGDDPYGGGFLYQTSTFLTVSCSGHNLTDDSIGAVRLMNISDSLIAHNVAHEGPGLMMNVWPGLSVPMRFISLHNLQLLNNSGESGISLLIWQYSSLQPESHLVIDLVNVSVTNNRFLQITNDSRSLSASAVLIAQAENVTFNNVLISNNTITGLHLYNTVMTIKETNTTVINNTALEGGGIFIRGTSVIIFEPPSNLILSNNFAQYGGGIYFQQTTVEDDRPFCFFQVNDPTSINSGRSSDTHIYSIDNRASVAGDFLYSSTGGVLTCRLVTLFLYYTRPSRAFDELVVIRDQENEHTTFSSFPIRVCLCDAFGRPNCTETRRTINVIPGSVYNITVATVGFKEGLTPGIVNNVFRVNEQSVQESVFRTINNCTTSDLVLRIYSENMTIEFTADQSTLPDHNHPITLDLNLLPCPLGYQFSPALGVCSCNHYLQIDSVSCNSTTWNITRSTNKWITYSEPDNCTIVYTGCPFDYCNTSSVTFPLSSPDMQCINNRVGLLCGHCALGYSLVLGSNACQKCSNAYLSLVLVFILAGIALVVFIFALNFTVTVGMFNGLIFYANIVKINEFAFFPDGPVPVLSVFISWINLDLGFEVCFYDGLDAFAKVWLQFAFPLYIASIVIGLIILCHYSKSAAKLLGNNAVPVLATLILLSYTKVLRTIIAAMQMGIVKCNGSFHSAVWLVDGTVGYFSVKHGILLLVCLGVFILIAIPYTCLILFIPLVERKTPRKLRWILKLKPYFDATCGELHDDARYWVGLLLLFRLILTLIIPFTSSTVDTSVILIAVIFIMIIVWNLPSGSIYKKRYLDLLESWYILNLGLISVLTLGGGTRIATILISSLIFVTFIGIVIFHIFKRLRKIEKLRISEFMRRKQGSTIDRIIVYLSYRRRGISNKDLIVPKNPARRNVTNTIVDVSDYNVIRRRESLLYSKEYVEESAPVSVSSQKTGNTGINSECEVIEAPVSPTFMQTEFSMFDRSNSQL